VSDEKTQNLTDGRSFEERVFARFDALDARMDRIEGRMDRIEARLDNMEERLQALEQKSYDTKPIWERALAEILALSEKVEHIERKFDVLATDMLTLRARQSRIEDRMDRLEPERAQ
jgi:chromosome segregation ATPase